jgi:hypothetical protein
LFLLGKEIPQSIALEISEFCRVERWLSTQPGQHQKNNQDDLWKFRSAQEPVAHDANRHRRATTSARVLTFRRLL